PAADHGSRGRSFFGRGLHASSGARSSRVAKPAEAEGSVKIRLLWATPALALYAQTFRDPAPPVTQTPVSVQAPAARANPAVHFYTKPKPLPAGAVTSDW